MFRRTFAAFAVALLVLSSARLQAQALPDDISSLPWVFEGGWPAATARVGSVHVFAGSFKAMARRSHVIGPFGVFDATTARLTAAEPRLAGGRTRAVVADGRGGWYLGGFFLVDGAVRYLVRVTADGRLGEAPIVAGGPGVRVSALARSGSTVYLGGSFTSVGQQARTNAAAIDVQTGTVASWQPTGIGDVEALLAAGGQVFIGGASALVRVDATTGAATVWPGDVSGVSALAVSGAHLFVGGRFTTVSGEGRHNLAAFDLGTGALLPFAPSPAASVPASPRRGEAGEQGVLALSATATTLYVGGTFDQIDGLARQGAAAVDIATGAVLPWAPLSVPSVVHALATRGGQVYVGGEVWPSIGGFALAADGVTGAVSPLWQPRPGNVVHAMAAETSGVAIAGSFSAYNAFGSRGLAAADIATLQPWPVPTLDGSAYVLLAAGRTIYVGGQYFSVNRQPRSGLAAFDLDLGLLESFTPTLSFDGNSYFPATASSLALAGSDLFVGGQFDTVGGLARNSLAAVDATTGAVRPFAPLINLPASITRLVVTPGRVWASGSAAVPNGSGPFFGLFDAATGAAIPTPLPASVAVASAFGGWVYAFSGGPPAGLHRIDPATFASQLWGQIAGVSTIAGASDGLAFFGAATHLFAVDLPSGARLPWTVSVPSATFLGLAATAGNVLVSAYNSGGVGAGWPAASFERRSEVAAPAPVADLGVHVQGDLVTVRWVPGTHGALPASYRVEVGSRPGATDLATLALPRHATGLSSPAPSGTYFLRVVAQAVGLEAVAPELAFVVGTPGCATPPVTAPVLQVVNPLSPELRWAPPEATNVLGYELRVGPAPGNYSSLRLPLPASQTAFPTAGAPPGVYHAAVVAVTACGMSVPSNGVEVVVLPPDAPAPPTNLAAQVSGHSAAFTWVAPSGSVTGYVLEAGSAPGLANLVPGAVLGPGKTVAVPGVPPGRYYVRIRAVRGAVRSAPSNEVVVGVP